MLASLTGKSNLTNIWIPVRRENTKDRNVGQRRAHSAIQKISTHVLMTIPILLSSNFGYHPIYMDTVGNMADAPVCMFYLTITFHLYFLCQRNAHSTYVIDRIVQNTLPVTSFLKVYSKEIYLVPTLYGRVKYVYFFSLLLIVCPYYQFPGSIPVNIDGYSHSQQSNQYKMIPVELR